MPDQETIDRVARAIYGAENPVIGDVWWDTLCTAALSSPTFLPTYRRKAIAAIKAMEDR